MTQSTYLGTVTVSQLVSLGDLGLPASSFRFGQLTMDSDKFVTVKDGGEVAIVDMQQGNGMSRRPMKAEGALMHPERQILALKGSVEGTPGQYVQVYDLGSKTKLFNHQFAQGVVYWKWVTCQVLALVTETSVFHWTMGGGSASPETPPSLIFERSGPLATGGAQIIGYTADAKLNWCLLSGISSGDGGRTIDGHMQLYSQERKQGRTLDGHAGCFAELFVDDSVAHRITTFAWIDRSTLNVMDLTKTTAFRVQTPIDLNVASPDAPAADFAVFVAVNERQGLGYVVTKAGVGLVFDPVSGVTIWRGKISQDPVFLGSVSLSAFADSGNKASSTCAVAVVNRRGQVLGLNVAEASLIPFIQSSLHRPDIAMNLCRRYPIYAGADDIILSSFNQFIAQADFKRAAELVARSPSNSPLRSPDILARFRSALVPPGQPSAMSVYFSTLLENSSTKLNPAESLELVRPVAAQGRRELLEKWLKEERLSYSDELAEVVKQADSKLAVLLYAKVGKHDKVLAILAESGNVEQVLAYIERVKATPGSTGLGGDMTSILRVLIVTNSEGSVKVAREFLAKHYLPVEAVFETYSSLNRIPELTAVMVEHLRGNRPEDAKYQTSLFELNISKYPQAAETLFQLGAFSHFDKVAIAKACEKAGMHMRACELWASTGAAGAQEARRCVLAGVNAGTLSPDWVVKFAGGIAGADVVEIVGDLLRYNREKNLSLAVQIAVNCGCSNLGPNSPQTINKLVAQFENLDKSRVGAYHFLGGLLGQLTAKAVLLSGEQAQAVQQLQLQLTEKYVEGAISLGEWSEVERQVLVGKYDAVRLRDMLRAQATTSEGGKCYQVLCEKQGFVEELVQYQLKRGDATNVKELAKRLTGGVGVLLGVLLDQGADESMISEVLSGIHADSNAVVQGVIDCFTQRNRLRSLRAWLEKIVAAPGGNSLAATAVAKIYIDLNVEPSKFIASNAQFDTLVIGNYAAKKDPYLAVQAFRKGGHSAELLEVCERNQLYKLLAEYLVELQDQTLWSQVLNGPASKGVVDAVIHTAGGVLGGANVTAEAVSATVKAFMAADMPSELLELLEKIVLSGDFSKNRSLQNLLLLTAIRTTPSKVKDYIKRLDNYDGAEIAKVAIGEPHRLFEEALDIYVKFNLLNEAMDVILYNLQDLTRAVQFAELHAGPGVSGEGVHDQLWARVGRAYLDNGLVKEAIASYMKSHESPKDYLAVIEAAHREEEYLALIDYLRMARTKIRDSTIDTELLYALSRLSDNERNVQEFLDSGHAANVNSVADRLHEEKVLKQAKMLYSSTNNFGKLSVCLLELGELQAAVEAAKKANSPKIWRDVLNAALSSGGPQGNIIQTAGLQLISYPDHLEEVISLYDQHKMQNELATLLETAIALDKTTHIGIYTELGVLYVKRAAAVGASSEASSGTHRSKLLEFLKTYGKKVNVVKLVRICESVGLFKEAAVLLAVSGDYEGALSTVVGHYEVAYPGWEEFIAICKKVVNVELLYKAVEVTITTGSGTGLSPSSVSAAGGGLLGLVSVVGPRMDQTRLITLLSKYQSVGKAAEYFKQVQTSSNGSIPAVNEAVNEFYLEHEDFESLSFSVSSYGNFDKAKLASRLEKVESAEGRKIAALLYAKNKNHKQAVKLLKAQGLYSEAISTVKEAQDPEAAKSLVNYFIESQNKNEFKNLLQVCHNLLKPDFVIEASWKAGWTDLAMPYFISVVKDMGDRIDKLEHQQHNQQSSTRPATNQQPTLALPAPIMGSSSSSFSQHAPSGPGAFPF